MIMHGEEREGGRKEERGGGRRMEGVKGRRERKEGGIVECMKSAQLS